MKSNKIPVLFLLVFLAAAAFGQSRGAVLDNDAYESLPRKASLSTRAYEGLPGMYSLKQFAPLPGDQTDYGTCVAWASAYAARTISESIALNRRNQTETTQNVFSPVYVYKNIRPDDPECQQGTQISRALDMMRDTGAVKMLEIERNVIFPRVDLANYANSKRFPIAGYATLFANDDRYKPGLVTRMVKKSLTEGKPVIIGMNTPDSFFEAKNVWMPRDNPGLFYGGHAMCVVGYDDSKEGGAFEIINSWGRKWGNAGFIWVPYKVFVDFVMEGYEMIENLAVYSEDAKLDGFIRVEIPGQGAPRQAGLIPSPGGVYKTAESFTEGARFRFILGARESAYVYAFAVSRPAKDGVFHSAVQMFPQAGVSPLLNYSNSEIFLPGEDRYLVMDAEAGMEYLVMLQSKQALDLSAIIRRFNSDNNQTIEARLAAAVGPSLTTKLSYDQKEAAFTAELDDPRAVAGLVVAVEHK
jgi:hypothetical protein